MNFALEEFTHPEEWSNVSQEEYILSGRDGSADSIDLEDVFEEPDENAYMMHKARYRPTEPNNEEDILGDELETGGEFYNVEIGEELNWDDETIFAENAENLGLDSGLFNIHFTGYRDPSGDDHIVHCDPKVWKDEGKKKFTGDPPSLPLADEGFQDDENYEMVEGLKQLEGYIESVKQSKSDDEWASRWTGVQNTVEAFRESYLKEDIYHG